MRTTIIIAAALAFAVFVVTVASGIIKFNRHEIVMNISSSAFKHNGDIPRKYTCDGDNVNPPLEISGIPAGTKALALIVLDPDAPSGLWVHWTLWNILPEGGIPENAVSLGATEGMTNFGRPGYGGPCPPDGEHRYFFKIYALDAELTLPPDADKEMLEEAMVGHVLDRAELVGLYER